MDDILLLIDGLNKPFFPQQKTAGAFCLRRVKRAIWAPGSTSTPRCVSVRPVVLSLFDLEHRLRRTTDGRGAQGMESHRTSSRTPGTRDSAKREYGCPLI